MNISPDGATIAFGDWGMGINTGIARIDNDRFCHVQSTTERCAMIFRNSGGTRAMENEYFMFTGWAYRSRGQINNSPPTSHGLPAELLPVMPRPIWPRSARGATACESASVWWALQLSRLSSSPCIQQASALRAPTSSHQPPASNKNIIPQQVIV
jgi:hypothetical protein